MQKMCLKTKHQALLTQPLLLLLLLLRIKIHDHSAYITTLEFTKLTAKDFTARLKQRSFATKVDIADLVKQQILMMN